MSDVNPCLAHACIRCCRDILMPLSVQEVSYLRSCGAILIGDDSLNLELMGNGNPLFKLEGKCPRNKEGICLDKDNPQRPKICGVFEFDGPICQMLRSTKESK